MLYEVFWFSVTKFVFACSAQFLKGCQRFQYELCFLEISVWTLLLVQHNSLSILTDKHISSWTFVAVRFQDIFYPARVLTDLKNGNIDDLTVGNLIFSCGGDVDIMKD